MKSTETVTRAEDAEILHVLGDEVRIMGQVDGTDLHVVEVSIPPGSGTPPHRHRSIEIFRVAKGTVTFGVFGDGPPRSITAGPGTVVTMPSNLGHNYQNAGDTPAVMTAVVEGQMIDFFRDVSASVTPASGPPTPAQIAIVQSACAQHGIDLL